MRLYRCCSLCRLITASYIKTHGRVKIVSRAVGCLREQDVHRSVGGERRLFNTQKYLPYFVPYVVPCHSGAQFHGQLKTSKMKTHTVAAAEISSI